MKHCLRRPLFPVLALVVTGFASAIPASAQVILSPAEPVIGSSNTVSADPTVSRPSTPSCTVYLFQNLEFADYNTKNYTYVPPKSCPGPWAKVVLTVDFTVTAGTQYDRTAEFYLGGANIFFGTTAEPGAKLSPHWHVERDVTDLSSVLTAQQAGTAIIGNYVGVYNGVDYNGIIYATAKLHYYGTGPEDPAPAVPQLVIGVPGNSGTATLNTSSSVYKQTLKLPTNVTGAYLDVIAQSQSNDEFWYTCVPNALTTILDSCGNTGFRETEITIDGQPAGVAPVYPWIYTGGIDPYLWFPIAGVQTLNFKPFRVNLTPFAAQLSDGKTHTVGIQVYNADSYFSVAANLLLYTDPYLAKVTGKLNLNTLASEPEPEVEDNIVTDGNGDAYGSVTIKSVRDSQISGYVTTSSGLQVTTVNEEVVFKQTQLFTSDPTEYLQDIAQSTTATVISATSLGGTPSSQVSTYSYPFLFNIDYVVNPDGTSAETLQSSQQDIEREAVTAGEEAQYSSKLSNSVTSQDTLQFDADGNFIGNTGTKSAQTYNASDTFGDCYSQTITSAKQKVATVVNGAACPAR